MEEEERKGSICSKAIKGAPTEGAGIPCKERSIGKEVKESRRKRGGVHG